MERRFGWDCHGLPIEYAIDKKLGITSKEQHLAMGIPAYNEECRSIVQKYASEWRYVTERYGRWIDMDNDWKTMNPTFMESVWWVFKSMYDKGLVYQGFKVMPYSTACHTPLSNFEKVNGNGSRTRGIVCDACSTGSKLQRSCRPRRGGVVPYCERGPEQPFARCLIARVHNDPMDASFELGTLRERQHDLQCDPGQWYAADIDWLGMSNDPLPSVGCAMGLWIQHDLEGSVWQGESGGR